jgi:uncharacterized membrane protein (DUF373 family)
MRISRFFKALLTDDEQFLNGLKFIERFVSRLLSIGMILVTFVAIVHLGYVLIETLIDTAQHPKSENFNTTLFQLFGLFLNVLIALEILENITAYLKKQVIQVELVLITSLIAVSRKIIILDLEKKDSNDLIALSVAVFALSISYLAIRLSHRNPPAH